MCPLSRWVLLLRSASVCVGLALTPWSASTAQARESNPADDEAIVTRWYQVYDDLCESFELRVIDAEQREKVLKSQPVLTMFDAIDTGVRHGRVYLWTDEQRPVALCSFWSRHDPATDATVRNVAHEFHSLSRDTVVAESKADGFRVWNCKTPGVEWFDQPDWGEPSGSRNIRLTQMRRIALAYTVTGGAEGQKRFRLLAQPIYRYPEPIPGASDGAIFVLGQTTDPNVFLWVEAREAKWSVAFARASITPLRVRDRGRTIWSCERAAATAWKGVRHGDFRSEPFSIHFAAEQRSADEPENVLVSYTRP